MDQRAEPPSGVRLLVLLNPGRMSRHWLLGIARGAERMGILAGTLELGPIWQAVQQAGSQHSRVREQAGEHLKAFCLHERVTHVLSYTHNGVFDFGMSPDPATGQPAGLFASLGIEHILLWSDHPNWASDGIATTEPVRTLLNHPRHHHFVKSAVAAEEIRTVLGWANVRAMDMGEDMLMICPDDHALALEPMHDATIIMGDAAPIPERLHPFLAEDDPDVSAMMRAMLAGTLEGCARVVEPWGLDAAMAERCRGLCEAMCAARIGQPMTPFWELCNGLGSEHTETIAMVRADPQRWYTLMHALHALTGWRRFFWPAWLGRRANLGVYGSPGSRMGLADMDEGAWVQNKAMASVYARGACAININAAHDEAGMTHKPFQIASAGVAPVHHATPGLEDAFTPGEECIIWTNGPELLDAVRRLRADRALRRRMGERARERCIRDHTWEHRLSVMLEACARPAAASAFA
ncbi:MAG: glycosyltransferase family 1 protein [Phycisphaeraceae bacterium]|nr:MAG: glycosyltransferase family 1 protein [Phycisphaeraceae bacterium]